MISLFEEIYLRAPHVLKDLFVSIYGMRNEHLRKSGNFNNFYMDLMSHLELDAIELQKIQLTEFKNLLLETMQYSQFYNKIMIGAGLSRDFIESVKNVEELLHFFPIVDKATLKNQIEEIISNNPRRNTIETGHTSGTTGTPLFFPIDSYYNQRTFAEWERYYHWMNIPKNFSSIRFSGRIIVHPKTKKPPYWCYNSVSKQLFMSTYHLTNANLPYYVKKINDFKPQLIDGYPSAIYIIARYLNGERIELDHIPLAISTTAETLGNHQRQEIETAFKCKVFNQYASAEGSPWIVECAYGNMHLWTDTGIFEFINPVSTPEGTKAELLVTSFRSRKMPLIRYRIGDQVFLSDNDEKCPCGSAFPIIKNVVGREDDIMFTSEKGYVGRLSPALKEIKGILRAQLIEIAIDDFDLLIMVDKTYDKNSEEKLLKSLKDRLGESIKISIHIIDEIPLGKNGKFKAFINLINKEV